MLEMENLNRLSIALQNIGRGVVKFAEFCNRIEQALNTPEVIQKISQVLENIQSFPAYEKKAFEIFPRYGWFPNEYMYLNYWQVADLTQNDR